VHQSVRDQVIGTIPLDIRASEAEIIEATLPVAERAERERETELIDRIENGAGPGGGAVRGPDEILTALQTGQVMTLAMNEDFTAPGWADYSFPMYGVGAPPAAHPGGGHSANMVPVALEQEVIRLALQTGAESEIVKSAVPNSVLEDAEQLPDASAPVPRTEAARRLDALGGVGALLRYTLSDDQSTADL
jgi:peptide subunit release factor 1 (eRF1)